MASTHPNGSLRPQNTIGYDINMALLTFLCEQLFRASLLNSSPASSPIVYYTAVFRHWCSVVTQRSSPALKVRLNHGYVKSVQNSRKFSFFRSRESKTAISTEFYAMDSKFQSLSVERGFWIPIVSGIPDSLSCIPDSKAQESGLHKQNFPRFRNWKSVTVGETVFFFLNECRPWQADWIVPEWNVMRRLHLGTTNQMVTSST